MPQGLHLLRYLRFINIIQCVEGSSYYKGGMRAASSFTGLAFSVEVDEFPSRVASASCMTFEDSANFYVCAFPFFILFAAGSCA